MKAGCLLILVTVALLWGGGQGLYTAITNSRPSEFTIEKYLQEKPPAKWLRLTGGTLDLTNLNYTSFLGVGRVSELYVPLRPAGETSRDEVHILLATKDPGMLEIAEKMRQAKTEDAARHFVQEHGRELVVQKNVEGLVRFGLELEDRDVRKLRELNEHLAPDFVVVADRERPEYLFPLAAFLGGVTLAAFLLKRVFGAPPQPPGSQPPPLPSHPNKPPPLPVVS